MRRSYLLTGLLALLVVSSASSRENIEVPLPGGERMRFVWIEPGSFLMGTPEDEEMVKPFEIPQHPVTIERGFYLGQFEITQRQWTAVTGAEPWVDTGTYGVAHPDHPAVYVSWLDVQDFIGMLNDAEGASLYRLPTEAEWEYAGRAGTTTRWSWGDDPAVIADFAWYRDNTNAWEWVHDWSALYQDGAQVDPKGPDEGTYRIVRGGIFMGNAVGLRSAFRYGGSQDFPDGGVGARLVRQDPSDPGTSVQSSSWGQVKKDDPGNS